MDVTEIHVKKSAMTEDDVKEYHVNPSIVTKEQVQTILAGHGIDIFDKKAEEFVNRLKNHESVECTYGITVKINPYMK